MNTDVIKNQMFLAFILLCASSPHVYAEMPQEPNIEELCESAKLVLCAEPIKKDNKTQTIGLFNKTKYTIITFKVHRVYRGNYRRKEIRVLIPTIKNAKPTDMHVGCSIKPVYKEGKRYFLFLKKRPFSKLYIRVKIDDVFGERKWDREKEQQVIEELNFLSDPDKWKKPGDNLNYTIPEDANEKIVELTEYQKKRSLSKKATYWLNGKLVGERFLYENGQTAVEHPIKNGMRHGITKGWYPDGRLFEIRPLRKGRLHGVLKQWDNKGNLKTSYWIRGKPVSLKKYRKACKTNMTLPRIKE